ncbi:hypothetical protein [Nonomuraea turkmeniaca]|uniref:alpha-L-rhamnosidase-related protein n=1 Tax=Nonomuraea turkmeniaca TaxID=103838 RepID=UPI003CCC6722
MRWGQRGNFVSVPTDCRQRGQRLGWLADAQVFLPTAARGADVAAFFADCLPAMTAWVDGIEWHNPNLSGETAPAATTATGCRRDQAGPVLTGIGRADLAYRLLHLETFPSLAVLRDARLHDHLGTLGRGGVEPRLTGHINAGLNVGPRRSWR